MDVLIVIPARGGSKGIPRKNLRPLNSLPLLYYSINNALKISVDADIYVSSDDDEILNVAGKYGAKMHKRNSDLAKDVTTLDPVIYDALLFAENVENKKYDLVITMQPTSPLLKSGSIQKAIDIFSNNLEVETVISAVNDTHLSWTYQNNEFSPLYEKRLNRQYLKPQYKETGGFLMCRRSVISESNRIGKKIELYELGPDEAIDIDTYEDWNLCDYFLKRKNVVFCISGYKEIGLGHVYNAVILAHEILNHKVSFLVDKKSQLAFDKLSEINLPVQMQKEDDIVDDLLNLNPDLVISDRLDTTKEYVERLTKNDIKTVNFEDLGEGAQSADLVFNAIYPEKNKIENHFYGSTYFCARSEFIYHNPIKIKDRVERILLTFGGVDPNNLTLKVLDAIYDYCVANSIQISIITGLGYEDKNLVHLQEFENVEVLYNISNISDHMVNSDMAFTSAGRTTYELALLGIPSVVLCQNKRELTHFFAYKEHGFDNLGLGINSSSEEIKNAMIKLVEHKEQRVTAQNLMLSNEIRSGKKKVLKKINDLIEDA